MLTYSLDLCHIKRVFLMCVIPADAVANPKPAKDGIRKAIATNEYRKKLRSFIYW